MTQTAQTTDNDIAAVCLQLGKFGLLRHNLHKVSVCLILSYSIFTHLDFLLLFHGQDQFTHMFPSLDHAERRLNLRDGHRLDGRWLNTAVTHEADNIFQQPSDRGFGLLDHQRQIYVRERDVLEEEPAGHQHVIHELLATDLDKSPIRCDGVARLAEHIAGERIQHDIHATVRGHGPNRLSEGRVAAREDVVLPDTVFLDQELLLLGAADSGIHFCAEVLGEDDSGLTDSAGCGVDKKALALSKAATVHEGVVNCRPNNGE